MQILALCHDLFDESPAKSVKNLFKSRRKDHSDEGFFKYCIQYLGGRSYNKFLDYSLFAIKLNRIWDKHCHFRSDCPWEEMQEGIIKLLADDRHDLWQNLPYLMDRAIVGLSDEEKSAFWSDVVDAMIDCINVAGTGDISTNFKVPED